MLWVRSLKRLESGLVRGTLRRRRRDHREHQAAGARTERTLKLEVDGGAATLQIDRDGAIKLESQGDIEIKGNNVTVEAQGELNLKGGAPPTSKARP